VTVTAAPLVSVVPFRVLSVVSGRKQETERMGRATGKLPFVYTICATLKSYTAHKICYEAKWAEQADPLAEIRNARTILQRVFLENCLFEEQEGDGKDVKLFFYFPFRAL
jgi:hypothetical protein